MYLPIYLWSSFSWKTRTSWTKFVQTEVSQLASVNFNAFFFNSMLNNICKDLSVCRFTLSYLERYPQNANIPELMNPDLRWVLIAHNRTARH